MQVFQFLDDPQVADLLLRGSVGIIPTDTIYGLAVSASNKSAVQQLYALKARPDGIQPGTVIASRVEQLVTLGIDSAVVDQVAHFWPNPLSIELPLGPDLEYLYQSGSHRASRVVADPAIRSFLEITGPLLTSSANLHGQPPATSIQQAKDYFGDKVDFYVDGGDRSDSPPSTVARLDNGNLVVVRAGAVTIEDITRREQ